MHPAAACTPQPDEYEKLGSYALIGLPDDLYPTRFVEVRLRAGSSQGRPAREFRRWQGARCQLRVLCALVCSSCCMSVSMKHASSCFTQPGCPGGPPHLPARWTR